MSRLDLMRPAPLPSPDEMTGLELLSHAWRGAHVPFDEDDMVRVLIYRRALRAGLFTDKLDNVREFFTQRRLLKMGLFPNELARAA